VSEPYTIAYYYRTRRGAHDEFVALFERNHCPILREQLDSGWFRAVDASTPRFHGDGHAAWDFVVTITYRDWAAIEAHADSEIAARLFTDITRHRAEEVRRFELLEAHWDVVLQPHPLPPR
jgi:regulation of enolase protein 1 (concanavalin A-like superfamily)